MKAKFNLLVLSLAAVSTSLSAMAYDGQELAKDAKIDISQARSIATKTHPGKVVNEELENEHGNGLVYSFKIKNGSNTQEIGVDAITGKVIEDAEKDD